MNNPPFKVICIDDSPHINTGRKVLHKGKIYTVIYVDKDFRGISYQLSESVLPYKWMSYRFAPIQTDYADVTAEIMEKFKSPNETPDKVNIPQPINQ